MRHSKKDAVRLNKLISEAGFCSRREADEFIEQERVTVNSHVAKPGDKVYRTDFIRIDGEPLRFVEKQEPVKKKREFASKRISRNNDTPKKDKAEKPLKEKKADRKVEVKTAPKEDAKPPKVAKAYTSPKSAAEGEAKKWFSGRKKR